jgi:hypothetical protein
MPEHDPKLPPVLNYAPPDTPQPVDRWLEHYLALAGLILVTGFSALVSLCLGLWGLTVWVRRPTHFTADNRLAAAGFLLLGLICLYVCIKAIGKFREST